jgi:hypothetical protein
MDLAQAKYLLSDRGLAAVAAASAVLDLAPHKRPGALRGMGSAEEVRAALAQALLRRRARVKTPHAERLLFTEAGLEQATPWEVAEERARRWPLPPGVRIADLGAGLGLDALALAGTGRPVLAVERDPVRALFLRHNVRALGLGGAIEVREEDAHGRQFDAAGAFLDPDRRPGGRRRRDANAFEPPVAAWGALLRGYVVALVKAPPADHPSLPADVSVEVVSLRGEARERRLLWRGFEDAPPRRALALPGGAAVAGTGQAWPEPRAPRPGLWLLDPDPSVTLAGVVGDLCDRERLAPVHPRIAYLLGDAPAPGAPGTWLHVEAVLAPEARAVNAWLARAGVGRAEVRCRGVSDDAEAWRRRLRLKGPNAATLVFTRGPDDRWVALVAERAGE